MQRYSFLGLEFTEPQFYGGLLAVLFATCYAWLLLHVGGN